MPTSLNITLDHIGAITELIGTPNDALNRRVASGLKRWLGENKGEDMSKYLTVVLKLADNAESKLVFDQADRINGATMSAASWSHVMDERDRYREALEKIADTDPDDLQVFHDIANKALVDA